MKYQIWRSDYDIQLIPVGEDKLHLPDIICKCEPNMVEDGHHTITTHKSFIGEVYGMGLMHTVQQELDC